MIENDNELENGVTIIKDNVLLPVLDIEVATGKCRKLHWYSEI